MAYSGLDTYLNDHIAGAIAGVNLAKMAAEEHQTDEHGPFFSEIYAAIQADFDTLQQLATSLGVDESASKSALAEVGSKVMAPKFTGGEDDELNAFVTLETLSIGIEGKVCMWKALKTVESEYAAFKEFDIDELVARGISQREKIEEQRQKVAPLALTESVPA
ncbi:MAG TPA: hypothetical protein VGV90_18530 [Solirubrobacteraceae bacterium]|nr:hypothetical protein [Solirubrobacteraceae bacterium]